MSEGALRVLVVDDEGAVRYFLERFFEREGYTVTCASDGQEALDLISKQSFDILFTDVRMPHMSGDKLAGEAKKKRPEMRVVLMTAFQDATLADRCKPFSDGYIQKPFRVDDLRKLMTDLTGRPFDETPPEGASPPSR